MSRRSDGLIKIKRELNDYQGYAVDSRTYYILGLSFARSEAYKPAQVSELPELSA